MAKKKEPMKHGIAVREIETGKLVKFLECDVGRPALRILSGVRMNLNHEDYEATEDMATQEEIDAAEKEEAARYA